MHLKSIDLKGFKALLILFALLLSGCGSDAQINFYDKSLKSKKLNCLNFNSSSKGELEEYLKTLYKFDNSCKNTLSISYKSDIVCKSSYNAPIKATSNFPNSYLTLEVKRGFKLLYSYYIDLNHKPTKSDVKEAFSRLKDDIL